MINDNQRYLASLGNLKKYNAFWVVVLLKKWFSVFVVLSVLVSIQLSSVFNSYHYVGAHEIELHNAALFFENQNLYSDQVFQDEDFTLEFEVDAYNDQYDEENKISQLGILVDFSIPAIQTLPAPIKNNPFISTPDELHPPVPPPA